MAFCSSRATRTRVSNQIRDLIVTAPDQLRHQLGGLDTTERVDRWARFRPAELSDPGEATKAALRALARQYQALSRDLDELRGHLDVLTTQANPALRAAKVIGVDVASILLVVAGDNPARLTSDAAFAALCGASPVEASSGRITRHRLNQGGNRQGNHALWRIAMVRLTNDPETKTYAERRRAEGKTTRSNAKHRITAERSVLLPRLAWERLAKNSGPYVRCSGVEVERGARVPRQQVAQERRLG